MGRILLLSKPIVSSYKIVIGKVMKVTLSCDHRVIDGAMAGKFLQTLKQILQSTTEIN